MLKIYNILMLKTKSKSNSIANPVSYKKKTEQCLKSNTMWTTEFRKMSK